MSKLQKIMTQPIVRSRPRLPEVSDGGFWRAQKSRIEIWLFEQKDMQIEGQIVVRASCQLVASSRAYRVGSSSVEPVEICRKAHGKDHCALPEL
ncbi:hypothetical protein T484DRAFT_1808906 [Baffinella frigidus]|nr:hypothetical protein T484DRAFT_1808906 [Cryptophyta sp. CCMP2293]